MKIKTFTAPTEQEAMRKARDEMGSTAIIVSIKTISPKGLFKFFRKKTVEITAALDEAIPKNEALIEANKESIAKPYTPLSSENLIKDVKISEQAVKIQSLEKQLTDNEELLKKIVSQLTQAQEEAVLAYSHDEKFANATLQVFYNTLVENGVKSDIAALLLQDLDTYFDDENANISLIVKLVYNRIIQKLGEPAKIDLGGGDEKKIIVFMGPTGVGKTTTIAKLASNLMIAEHKKVGLVTADTYRIAAVEQLKTYGDILGVDVEVVYSPQDLQDSINKISRFVDIIFVDTAGRSHKNEENFRELSDLLEVIPDAEKFLVLSSTTRYEDLKAIADVYSQLGDFSVIFTKIDETGNLGLILNLCCETGNKLSYLTDGQNVPEDIRIAEPAMIAKGLLGSFDN